MHPIGAVMAVAAVLSWGTVAVAQQSLQRDPGSPPQNRGEAVSKEHGTTFPNEAAKATPPGQQVSPDKPVPDRSDPSTSHSR